MPSGGLRAPAIEDPPWEIVLNHQKYGFYSYRCPRPNCGYLQVVRIGTTYEQARQGQHDHFSRVH